MNYKKIMLVALVLLAVLTMGAVSASGDADNLAAAGGDDLDIASPLDDEILSFENTDIAVGDGNFTDDGDDPVDDGNFTDDGDDPVDDENFTDDDLEGSIEFDIDGNYDNQNDDETPIVVFSLPEESDGKVFISVKNNNWTFHDFLNELNEGDGFYYLTPKSFEPLGYGTFEITAEYREEDITLVSESATLTFGEAKPWQYSINPHASYSKLHDDWEVFSVWWQEDLFVETVTVVLTDKNGNEKSFVHDDFDYGFFRCTLNDLGFNEDGSDLGEYYLSAYIGDEPVFENKTFLYAYADFWEYNNGEVYLDYPYQVLRIYFGDEYAHVYVGDDTVEKEPLLIEDYPYTWRLEDLGITSPGKYQIHIKTGNDKGSVLEYDFELDVIENDGLNFIAATNYEGIHDFDEDVPAVYLYCPEDSEGSVNVLVNEENVSSKAVAPGEWMGWTLEDLGIDKNGDYEIKFTNEDDDEICDDVAINVWHIKTPQDELNNLIMDADEGSILFLDKDYIFSGPFMDDTSIGISIDKEITIDGQGHTIDANNHCTIFAIDRPGITLKNIIFRNGHVSDDWSGGAIGGGNPNLCVVNCTFENNIATDTDNAGAVAMMGDNIAIINSTFINNEGYNMGSILIRGNDAIISNCVFMNNRANPGDESETKGGAISIEGESATITGCVFINNTADLGSDIYIQGSSENFIIESCNSDAGDSSIYFDEDDEGGDDEFDPTKFSIDRRDDENNILALQVPVFSLYCPDGSQGTVDVTVSYNGNDYSVSRNLSEMDESNYLHWYLNDLNMNLLVKYEIHVNVNDGEFESDFDAYVHGPISLKSDEKLYINTFFDYLFIYFEVPSEYDDARVIVEFDGKNIFNKTLKEFEHADVANESYYWYHPSYGPGPGDERFKHYVVYNGVFGDIEAKSYNVTASIIFENSPIIGNHTFISTGTIDVVEGIVENNGVKMEAAHDRNYNLDDDEVSILFITAPEGANGKVTVSLNDKVIFESDLDQLDSEDGYYLLRPSKLELDDDDYELTFAYFEDDEKIVETSELFTFFHGGDDEGDDADDGVVIWVIEGDDKEFDFTNGDDRNSAFAYISVSNDLDGTIVFFYFAEDEDEVQDFYHIDLSDVNIKYADEEREGFTIYELSFNSVGGQSEIFEGADWFRFAFVTNYGEGEAESEVDSRKYDIEHDGNIIKFWQTDDEDDDNGELREDVLINGGNVVNNDVIISIPASLRDEVDDEFVVFMDEWDPAHFKFSELENEDGFYCIRISDLFAAEEINEGMGVNMIVQFYKEGENAYYAQPEDDEWGIELYTSPFLVEKAYILEDRMVISFRGFEGVDDEFTVTFSRDDFETAVVRLKISELTNLDDDIEGGFYEIHLSDLGIAEPGNYNIEVNFTANGEQALYNFGNVVVENLLIRAHGPDDDEDPVWRDVSNTVFHFGVTEDVAGFIKLFIDDEQVGGNISFTNFVFDDWPSHYGRQIILNDFQIRESGNYVLKVEAYDGEGNFLADCENNIEVEVTDNDVEFISGPYGNDIFIEFRIGTPLSDGQYYNIYLNGELAGNFTADYGVAVSDEYVDKLFEVKLLKPGHYDVNVTFFDGEKENDFKTGEIDINSLNLISDKTIYVYNVDDVLISLEMDELLEGYVLEAYYLKNWNRMDIYEEMLFNPYDSEGMIEDGLYEDGVVTINFAWSHHADEPSYMLDPGINYLHVKYRHENGQGISYGGIIAVRVIEAIIFVDEEANFPTAGENVDDRFAAISLPDDIDGIVVISCGDTVFFNKTLSTFDEGKLGPEDDMEDGICYVVSPQDVGFFEGLNDEDEIEIAVYDTEGNMMNSNRYLIFFEDDSFRLERIDDEDGPSDDIELNFEEDDEQMSFEMGDDVTIAYLLIPDTEDFEDTIVTLKIYKNGEVVQTIKSSDIERVLLGSREAYQYAIKVDLTKFEDKDLMGIWADCFDEDGRLWEYAVQIDGNNVIFHEYSGSIIEYYVFYGNITKGDLNEEDLMGEHPNGRFVSWGISDVFNITEGTIVIRDGETTIAEYSLDDCNVTYSYNILGNVYYLSLDDNNLSDILPENRNVTFTFSYADESLTFKRIRLGDYVYKVLTPDDFGWQEWSNFNFIIPDNISDENSGAVYILGNSNMQSVYIDFGGGYFSIYVNDTKVENLGHVLYRAWLNYPLEFNDEKIIISPDGDDYVVGIGTTEPISGTLTLGNENVVLCDIDISKDDENWKIDEFGRYHYEVSLKDISLDGVNNRDELRLVFFNDEDGYDRYFEIEIGDNFILLHPVERESYDAWGSELRLVNLRDGHHSLSDFVLSLADLGITESGTYNIRITHFPSVIDGLEYQGSYCDDVDNGFAGEYIYIAETELVNKNIIVDFGGIEENSTIELSNDIVFNYNETGSANVTLVGANDITAFVVGHDEAEVTFKDGVITVSGLDADSYTLNITTVPEVGFTATSVLVNVTVNKIDADLTVETEDISAGDKETITIRVTGFGIVNVEVGGKSYSIGLVDGVGVLQIVMDTPGTYNVRASVEGDKNINPTQVTETFNVAKLTPEIAITTGEAIEGSDLDVTVEIAGATGIVAINGVNVTLIDGKASTSIKDVAAGDLDIAAVYFGDVKYLNASKTEKVTVKAKENPNLTASAENINVGETAIVNIELNANVTGKVTVDGNEVTIANGKGTYSISNLTAGNHTFTVAFAGDKYFKATETTVAVKVSKLASVVKIHVGSDYNVGDSFVIGINATADAVVTINGQNYAVKDGNVDIDTTKLTAGSYTVVANVTENDKYLASSDTATFTVSKVAAPAIVIDVASSVVEGSNVTVEVTVAGATGTVNINGNEKQLNNSKASTIFTDVIAGNMVINVVYSGDDRYLNASNRTYVEVYAKKDAELVAVSADINVDDVAEINITINKDVTGKLTVNGEEVDVVNGTAKYAVAGLAPGNHTFTVAFAGDKYFKAAETTVAVKVSKLASEVKVTVGSVYYVGDSFTIAIANNTAAVVTINGQNYAVKDGKVDIDTTKLAAGNYVVVASIAESDVFLASSDSASFEVRKVELPAGENPFNFDDNTTVESKVPTYSISLPEDAKGTLTVTVGDNTFTADVVNGKATVVVAGMPAGSYDVVINYSGDARYSPIVKTSKVTVKVDPKIVAKDATVQYTAGKYYSVTVYGDNGKIAPKGTQVIFTLNGKQVAKTTTDAKGVAKFKVTQTPVTKGKIVAKALGVSVTKKLTITHAATLSTVAVKKSAKKITLKVTVKVNGKALKNKVVKFRFNNKLIKTKKPIKTDKKGIATVVVPTGYYKNLKVGKTVTYQVTYLKDTVKKTAKVKK